MNTKLAGLQPPPTASTTLEQVEAALEKDEEYMVRGVRVGMCVCVSVRGEERGGGCSLPCLPAVLGRGATVLTTPSALRAAPQSLTPAERQPLVAAHLSALKAKERTEQQAKQAKLKELFA